MFSRLFVALAITTALSACAGKDRIETGSVQTAFAGGAAGTSSKALNQSPDKPVLLEPAAWGRINNPSAMTGRELSVSSLDELKLRDKEVVLTFDDGPVPGKTERILATLDKYGVKATFLMVGEMAHNHPSIARKVVAEGHSIGSHTFRHANLRSVSFDTAVAEIARGRKAVTEATGVDANFFRFPYLADNGRLRQQVARNGAVVLDVQIDSKDYFRDSPATVASRTMETLRKRRQGIVLMHDIHNRTVTMLPALLDQMKAEGYKVVSLKFKKKSAVPQLMASLN